MNNGINKLDEFSWDKAISDADTLLLRNDINDSIKSRILFCKNVLINRESLGDNVVAALFYIRQFAEKYDIHNKKVTIISNNLRNIDYMPRRHRR